MIHRIIKLLGVVLFGVALLASFALPDLDLKEETGEEQAPEDSEILETRNEFLGAESAPGDRVEVLDLCRGTTG